MFFTFFMYGNHAFFLPFSLTDTHTVQTRTRAQTGRRTQKLVVSAAAAPQIYKKIAEKLHDIS